jgi:hypothetical protein
MRSSSLLASALAVASAAASGLRASAEAELTFYGAPRLGGSCSGTTFDFYELVTQWAITECSVRGGGAGSAARVPGESLGRAVSHRSLAPADPRPALHRRTARSRARCVWCLGVRSRARVPGAAYVLLVNPPSSIPPVPPPSHGVCRRTGRSSRCTACGLVSGRLRRLLPLLRTCGYWLVGHAHAHILHRDFPLTPPTRAQRTPTATTRATAAPHRLTPAC